MAYQPLAGQSRSGEPIITHDPASPLDLIVIETIDAQGNTYSPIAAGTAYPGYVDPPTGQTMYADFVLIGTKTLDSQYVQRIYQKLPGSWIYDKPVDRDGVLVQVKRRVQLASEITPSASATVTVEAEARDGSSVIAWEKVTTLAEVFDEMSQTKSSHVFIPERFRTAVVETETSSVAAGTDTTVSTPPVGGMNRKRRVTKHKVETTTRTSGITSETSIGKFHLGEWGTSQVTETLVDGSASAPAGIDEKTLAAESMDIGGGLSITVKDQLPAINTIKSSDIDPQTKIVTLIEKYLVAPASAQAGLSGGWYYEYKPAPWSDKATIQIRSKVDSGTLPGSTVIFDRPISVNFPDTLLSVEWVWAQAWATSGSDTAFDSKFAMKLNIKEGYRGIRSARVERTYHTSRPTAPNSSLWQPQPEQISLAITSAWAIASGGRAVANASASTAIIPPTLHAGLTISAPTGADEAPIATVQPGSVSATTPASIPSEVLYHFTIEEWRLGIWVMEKFYVQTNAQS
tara:strand:+ start:16468 stop:18015 length:1548 start_codon:yes stop_codon:yes gene_type:complete